ncbi:MAG: hypothetical protein MUC51_03735 [Anaerolineae bacterium]|nr:hypothetical protein [Anaerolineae bacterium]
MKQICVFVMTVLLLSVALSGCAGGKAPSPAEKAAATAEKSAATAQKAAELVVITKSAPVAGKPAATATKPATQTAKSTALPPTTAANVEDTLSVERRDAGLDKLKSYRSQWRGEWKSTEAGVTQSTAWDWFEEISTVDKAHHWGSKMTDSKSGKPTSFEFWEIGDTSYIMTTDEQGAQECMVFSDESQVNSTSKGLIAPGTLGGVSGAKYAGTDTVNGIRAKHYKYDEKAATLAGFGKVSGEIWVAEDGGYVVKDTLNWQGAAGLFGAGAKGTGSGTWTYQLQDVNKPLAIKPPEICEKGKVDVPVMADATEKARMGPMLTYKTAAKSKDVVDFYIKAMAQAGWQAEGEPQIADEMNTLGFTKDGATVQITIMPTDGKTQVMATISKD